MAIYKRGSTWWIDFATPRGERVRRYAQTGDKAKAQELHDQLTCWITDDQAKGGGDIHVSLSEAALAVLRRQRGKHERFVFTYLDKPVKQVNTKAWRMAHGAETGRDRKLPLARPAAHWASWLIQNGTPLYDLQEMGGWKSAAMVRRYAHLALAQMARHAALVDGLLRVTSTAQ